MFGFCFLYCWCLIRVFGQVSDLTYVSYGSEKVTVKVVKVVDKFQIYTDFRCLIALQNNC